VNTAQEYIENVKKYVYFKFMLYECKQWKEKKNYLGIHKILEGEAGSFLADTWRL